MGKNNFFFSYRNITVAIGFLAILISIAIFTKSRFIKKPIYAVSKPEAIAKLIKETDRMTILWDNEPIENAILVRVAIWNSGRRYIDVLDISRTTPIRILPSEDIKILSVEEIKTSRPELQFDTFIETSPNTQGQCVRIQILGDEALERNDGGLFKIIYSGSLDCGFQVKGRIKGSSSGFSRKSWVNVTRTEIFQQQPLRWVMFIGFVVYTLLAILYFMRGIKLVKQKRYKFAVIDIVFSITILFGNIFFFLRLFSYLWAPGWID